MTFSPKHPCRSPGCSALIPAGAGSYCPVHQRTSPSHFHSALADRARGTAAQRGYDADWQRERLTFLARYPLCMGVLIATEHWIQPLAEAFHALRESEREKGHLLLFGSPTSTFASISPRMTGENRGQTPGGEPAATVLRNFLAEHPIYRVEAWDVAQPATVVDHVVAHKGDYDLMWSQWNWQPLTKRAHDRKTATEQSRGNT